MTPPAPGKRTPLLIQYISAGRLRERRMSRADVITLWQKATARLHDAALSEISIEGSLEAAYHAAAPAPAPFFDRTIDFRPQIDPDAASADPVHSWSLTAGPQGAPLRPEATPWRDRPVADASAPSSGEC